MENWETDVLTTQTFKKLADVHDAHCVTIYMPTHRFGMEVNEQQDMIQFKDLVQQVKKKLERDFKMKEQEVKKYLQPAYDLMEHSSFWHNLSNGLAFYLSKKGMEVYRMPISFNTFTFVSGHYYLRPLFPFFTGDGRFFILTLSENEIRLYQASRFNIEEVDISDKVPKRLEETVGYDHTEKTLQGRSVNRQGSGKVFHGHGEGRDEEKGELEKFFRAVDKGILDIVNSAGRVPLVLSGVEQYYGIYREISHYNNLQKEFIKGNPEHVDSKELHKEGWEIVKDNFDEKRKQLTKQYQDLLNSFQTSYEISKIVPAALEGRVEALFINKDYHVWGIFDPESRKCEIHDEKRIDSEDLSNLAALKTYQQGGRVFLEDGEEMPEKGTMINGLFRY